MTVGHETFGEKDFALFFRRDDGLAVGGVDAADLDGFDFHGSTFREVCGHFGIHDAFAGTVSFAVVLFNVADVGVLADFEGMYAVVCAGFVAGVVDAASRNDQHVAVFADDEVVVDHFGQTGLRDENGDVYAFILGAGLDDDVDARFVGFGFNGDLFGVLACAFTVLTDIIRAGRNIVQIGDFFKQSSADVLIHFDTPFVLVHLSISTMQGFSSTSSMDGRMSSGLPRRESLPSAMRRTSSAWLMMRS